MEKGNLVKFIDWNDTHYDKVKLVYKVWQWEDILVHVPETNEKMWRLARHLGISQVRCLIQLLFLLSVLQ